MPRSILLIALALGLAVLATQARVVVGGATWDDATYQTEIVPARLAAAHAVHRGRWPAWWDGASLGVPLAAEPSHGAAYPPIWLGATPRALDLVMVLHVLWLALGVAAWARRSGSSELGAVTAGVLIATTGLVTSAALRGALPALSHLPWVGWAASGLAIAESRREAARKAAIVGTLVALIGLAGQLGGLADAIAIALVVGLSRRTWRYLAAGLAAGLVLAAAPWLPAFAIDTAGAHRFGLSPARLVELVVPGSLGARDPALGVPALASAGFPSLFVGVALLGLALVPRERTRRGLGLALGLGLAAFVVGRGGWPAWLGAPELHLAALIVIVAVRAARGVDAFVAADKRALVTLAIAAGGAAIVTWCMIALRDSAGASDAVIWRAVTYGGIGVGLVLGAVVLTRLAPRLRPLALALLVAPNVGALRITAPTIEAVAPPPWATLIDAAAPAHAPPRLYRNARLEKAGEPSAREALETLAGDAAARWAIAAVRTDDPARSPLDDAAWKASAHGGGELLERFGVMFAVLPASVVTGQGITELGRHGLWSLARYPAAPPATVVTDWLWVDDDTAALARLFPAGGGRGIAAGSVILRGFGPPPAAQEGHASTCELVRWDPGAIDLACDAASDGYAVVSSSATPGWTVEVDGMARPWFTADVLRRAVAIPAGKHAVRWRYALPGRRAAEAAALAGLSLLAALTILATRRP